MAYPVELPVSGAGGAAGPTPQDRTETVQVKIEEAPDGPDEVGVDFGLALSAEADGVISRSTGQADHTVPPAWRRPSEGAAE
ncbi:MULTISPECIES: CU044_2847 family protein [unclassified Streptomyces]|uniref:CU044_2847 family protein n=1 Tax=unclassified Streptomyces TaxID=2593676 RepID=UPI0009403B3E|nr:CU044_2847 family protein [Streptomyces sp. TSRI0281]OKI32179.1 hypothetical protein A6A29_21825 [Streptomyces sp. TSRI0281]